MSPINLLRFPLLRQALTRRWPLLLLRASALGGFAFAILAGLIGTPVGNHNFAIVAVWIAWWAALMLVIVPFLGRSWCAICPIPMPGEWLQQGAVLGPARPSQRGKVIDRRFPKYLRNIWGQNVAFTLLALFSAVILTRPPITAWVLLGMILLATGLSLVYQRRTFCRFVCPVGGFIGLYSQLAPLALRVINPQVCKAHTIKSCYQGSEDGYGCPWDVYPGGMIVNTNCGLCMECLRTCNYDNIALNLRAFGADLQTTKRPKLDEAYKALIMLGAALAYSAVMVGPWGALKEAAYQVGSIPWVMFTLGLVILTWVLLPGIFRLTTHIAQRLAPSHPARNEIFTAFSASLLPLGLSAWVAFSLSFVFASLSYLWPALSDPLGWGWDLLGTANIPWQPYGGAFVPILQIAVLLVGLFWAGNTAQNIALDYGGQRMALPVIAFHSALTLSLMALLIA